VERKWLLPLCAQIRYREFFRKTTMESLLLPGTDQTMTAAEVKRRVLDIPQPAARISPAPSPAYAPEIDKGKGSETKAPAVPCTHPTGYLSTLFPAKDFITGHQFAVSRCELCGLTLTTPPPAPEDIGDYYPAGYYGALSDRRFPGIVETLQQALYGWRVRRVESVGGMRRGKVLDIGCGRGLLLKEFRRRGWEAQGTELSDNSARYAREVLGLPVKTGSLEQIGFPPAHFDAITLWHVLEHVADPSSLLAEVHRILKPGGVLLVSVPNFGGCEARLFRDKWFHLDVPRHVIHLTRSMLDGVLRANGFTGCSWSGVAPEYDAFSFVQSALNRLGLRHNLLYDLLRGKQAKVIAREHTPFWQIPLTFVLGAIIGLISVPLTLCAGVLRQAGTTTVFAKKENEAPARSAARLQFIPHSLPTRS
jgi:SAM-dependent methyltransferase